jgi:hypothetical protein
LCFREKFGALQLSTFATQSALSGPSAMSAIRSLSGEKRTTYAHFETFRL